MARAVASAGLLAIWHDVVPEQAAALRAWYAREHHFERLAIPGFERVRRFDRVEGRGGAVCCLYEVEAPAVLHSAAYRARLAEPTAWTRAMMPHYRAMSRTVCRIAAHAGRAEGGHLAALACAAGAAPPADALQAALAPLAGVPGWRCIVAEAPPAEAAATAEAALRGEPDAGIAWAVLADAESVDAARTAVAALRPLAAAEPAVCGVYGLAFSARRS